MEVWGVREYKSFDDLVEQNKSLFKRIVDQGDMELMRACWSARDAEVNRHQRKSIKKQQELDGLKIEFEDQKGNTFTLENKTPIRSYDPSSVKFKNDTRGSYILVGKFLLQNLEVSFDMDNKRIGFGL